MNTFRCFNVKNSQILRIFAQIAKKMEIKTIGINNERPLFYATLALILYRLSPIVCYYLLIYKVLRHTGDSDRCF